MIKDQKCPTCGEEGAYEGTIFVECPNKRCIHYSEEQRIRRINESLRKIQKVAEEDPDKTPIMPWGALPKLPTDDSQNHHIDNKYIDDLFKDIIKD